MKKLLFTIKLISFMLFIFMLFSSMFITNIAILKYFITTTSLVILIFLIYTLYRNDIYLYKSLNNSLNNLIIYEDSLLFNDKYKNFFYLLKTDKKIKKNFLKFLSLFFFQYFLNLFLIVYEASLAKFFHSLINNKMLILTIILTMILTIVIILKILFYFSSAISIISSKTNKKISKLKKYRYLILKNYNKTHKIDIIIYYICIFEILFIIIF